MTNAHSIAVIAGDGVGKEVVPEGIKVIEAALPGINFELFGWGSDHYAKTGRMMPEDALETLHRYDAIYLGYRMLTGSGGEMLAPVHALDCVEQVLGTGGVDRTHTHQNPGRRSRPQTGTIADFERSLELHVVTAFADVARTELRQFLRQDGRRADRRRRNPIENVVAHV